MSNPVKSALRSYMTGFQGNFIGFFEVVSGILFDLGQEWSSAGKKEWGEAFHSCSVKIDDVILVLSKLKEEHDNQNQPQ